MSAAAQPSWMHPLLRLHHRCVEKRVTAAETAAAELGLELEAATIRQALTYERGQFPRMALKAVIVMGAFVLLMIAFYRGSCRPGGQLEPSPTTDCSWAKVNWFTTMWQFQIPVVLILGIMLVQAAMQGETIARCSKPLYPLLSLLTVSATVARPDTRYTEAINLSQQVSHLGLPLRTFARHAAADFGNRRMLRGALATHLNRVDAAFIEAADRLAGDREASAKQLAKLAALAANNIAAGRFTAVLPAEALAEEAPLEPDRLDGRRLATACLWAAVIVTASFIALAPLGAPVELLVPLALVGFLVLVYTLLAFRYGLSEATRLTRSIGGFFSASPPL
ncbi:hypothetical protein [Streptomyces sp. NPDC051636]|uniref:hypothetical protein n=1 Tax=Streptomyces sp. NPDC051636 TaxID=3365663 RepID=UPI0037AE46B9